MGRQQTTIRLTESLIEDLDNEADEKGLSRSEYIRELLENRHRVDELQDQIQSLRDHVKSREDRISDLEEQLRERREIEEKVEEVAIEVKEQRETGNAPFPVRWWQWWQNRGD